MRQVINKPITHNPSQEPTTLHCLDGDTLYIIQLKRFREPEEHDLTVQ